MNLLETITSQLDSDALSQIAGRAGADKAGHAERA